MMRTPDNKVNQRTVVSALALTPSVIGVMKKGHNLGVISFLFTGHIDEREKLQSYRIANIRRAFAYR